MKYETKKHGQQDQLGPQGNRQQPGQPIQQPLRQPGQPGQQPGQPFKGGQQQQQLPKNKNKDIPQR